MKKLILLVFLFFIAIQAHGYEANVIRVIDGDTIEVSVLVWPDLHVTTRLRLNGVNTPETRTRSKCEKEAGLRAKELTTKFVYQNEGEIEVAEVTPGKYARRILGLLYVDGISLSHVLLRANLAKPYSGGKREPWCVDSVEPQ